MARRSMYQFGKNLEVPKGNVDTGLGKNVAYGAVGVLVPNQIVTQQTQELVPSTACASSSTTSRAPRRRPS